MSDDLRESYRVLELDAGSSPEAVKRSYRDLVKLWHPDRYSPGSPLQHKAQERLKEINLAYERILKKPRAAGAEDPPPKSAHAAPATAEENPRRPRSWSAEDRDDEPAAESGESPDERAEPERMDGAETVEPPAPSPHPSAGEVPRTPTNESSPRRTRRWAWAGAAAVLLVVGIGGALRLRLLPFPAAATPIGAAAHSAPESAIPAAGPVAIGNLPPANTVAPAGSPIASTDRSAPPAPARPTAALPAAGTFTLGSTKAEVIAAQGTPDSYTSDSFQYGSSTVTFRNDRVYSWQEGTPALKGRVGNPEMAAHIGYFTTGSTKAEVIGIQGKPDSFTASVFQYGSSMVLFRDDRVESWREGSTPLKARVFPELAPSPLDYFTVGSSKDEVIAAQGNPDRFTATQFQYGSSLVRFDHDRVVSWQDGSPPLRARILRPLPAENLGFFTVGSTEDEVVSVQGLPDQFTPTEFQFGSSIVYFKDNKVTGWQMGSPPLKAQLPPASH